MKTLRVVTVSGDPESEARLTSSLSDEPSVELYMRCVERLELLACLRTGTVDVLVIVGVATWLDQQCLQEASARNVRVLCVLDDALEIEMIGDPSVEILPIGVGTEGVVEAIQQSHNPPPGHRVVPAGRLVSVWGPKGAPGRSTVAVELASEFAYREPRTLLLDADDYGGDLKQLLGIVEEIPTTIWAARLAARGLLEENDLTNELRRTGPAGPILLPGLPRPDLWVEMSDFAWKSLIDRLREVFAVTIADVGFCLEPNPSTTWAGEGRNAMTRLSLASSDRVVAVLRADPVGIRNFSAAFNDLLEIVDPEKVVIVANAVRPGYESEVRGLVRVTTGRPASITVPYSPAEVTRAASLGRSVKETKPGSNLSRSIRELAAILGAEVQRKGLLTRLAGSR